jgi:hypothetical protein
MRNMTRDQLRDVNRFLKKRDGIDKVQIDACMVTSTSARMHCAKYRP